MDASHRIRSCFSFFSFLVLPPAVSCIKQQLVTSFKRGELAEDNRLGNFESRVLSRIEFLSKMSTMKVVHSGPGAGNGQAAAVTAAVGSAKSGLDPKSTAALELALLRQDDLLPHTVALTDLAQSCVSHTEHLNLTITKQRRAAIKMRDGIKVLVKRARHAKETVAKTKQMQASNAARAAALLEKVRKGITW